MFLCARLSIRHSGIKMNEGWDPVVFSCETENPAVKKLHTHIYTHTHPLKAWNEI